MAAGDRGGAADLDWARRIEIRESPEVTRLLAERLPPAGAPRSVSVTELLALRPGFWRAVHGYLPPTPERESRMEEGRRLHRDLGPLVAPTGAFEVRVRRDGIHGRIDVLADRAMEVKTTGRPLPSDDLARSRPEHLEQLAMYCALADRPLGRLVYVQTEGDRAVRVAVHGVEFDHLPQLRNDMGRRADSFRRAVREASASELPRCPWFDRGCEWQAAGVCDCRGNESPSTALGNGHVVTTAPEQDRAASIEAALRAQTPRPSAVVVEQFKDLIYPRRAYYRRSSPPPTPSEKSAVPVGGMELYRQVNESVESGPLGEVARLPTRSDEPEEEVGGFRGDPYLVRTSRSKGRISPDEWGRRFPQYTLELALRCVATGRRRGWLVVGYEFAPRPSDRLQVLEVTLASPTVISRLWRGRAAALDRALRERAPGTLPACPGWMYESCPYRDACGCGSPPARAQ